jgi:hypothetical protein
MAVTGQKPVRVGEDGPREVAECPDSATSRPLVTVFVVRCRCGARFAVIRTKLLRVNRVGGVAAGRGAAICLIWSVWFCLARQHGDAPRFQTAVVLRGICREEAADNHGRGRSTGWSNRREGHRMKGRERQGRVRVAPGGRGIGDGAQV